MPSPMNEILDRRTECEFFEFCLIFARRRISKSRMTFRLNCVDLRYSSTQKEVAYPIDFACDMNFLLIDNRVFPLSSCSTSRFLTNWQQTDEIFVCQSSFSAQWWVSLFRRTYEFENDESSTMTILRRRVAYPW